MINDYLPEHWLKKLKKHALKKSKGTREYLGCGDFDGEVKVTFEDGSNCLFHCAFFLIDKKRKEICVFTEHCGYHIFESRALEISKYETKILNYHKGEFFE